MIVCLNMSSKLRFQVHYVDYYISHNAYGVDLSGFERRECRIDKLLERSFGSIRKWLHEIFNVNPKTHFLTVQTVINWGTEGDFLELMLIANTEEWRTYMQAALDRGWPLAILIQINQKAGHFGKGSTSTSSHMNQSMKQENKRSEHACHRI